MQLKPPVCMVGGYVDDAKSDAELVHLVRIELDLIEEGQDGTGEYTRRDVAAIRRWLRNHLNLRGEMMSRVTDLMENNRWVYWVNLLAPQPGEESTPPRYRVSIVVENESGHFPTGGDDVVPWYWDEETCRAKNAALGYSRKEELKIIGSSMFATAGN